MRFNVDINLHLDLSIKKNTYFSKAFSNTLKIKAIQRATIMGEIKEKAVEMKEKTFVILKMQQMIIAEKNTKARILLKFLESSFINYSPSLFFVFLGRTLALAEASKPSVLSFINNTLMVRIKSLIS